MSGLGTDEIVDCRTRSPVRERGTATFNLGAGAGRRYPFTLRLATPNSLIVRLDSDIADLRHIENGLSVNSLAGQLADGTIDIGLSPALQLPTPGVGRPMVLPLYPRRPSLRITPQGLAYAADCNLRQRSVGLRAQMAPHVPVRGQATCNRGRFPCGQALARLTSIGSGGTAVTPWTAKRSPRNW